ncbi:MAG: hypothetical protein IKU80_03840 [Firmicutes bacterium]|nr:hypothetical protein [Bacillota bacterium]
MGFWETLFLLRGIDIVADAARKMERAERLEAERLEAERRAAEEEYEDTYTMEESFSVTMEASFGEDEEDEDEKVLRELLRTVKKNISVDMSVFNKYGITFKHNLVTDCDTLQLNAELINTKKLAQSMNKYDEFAIKANIYDKNENLLCIEELCFDYAMLKSGYVADYFYFSDDDMCDAYSIRLYAIDPVDDEDEAEKVVSKVTRRTVVEEEYTNEVIGEGEYIYCSVSFGHGGSKTYYYRTEDETLKCGDEVIVFVGNEGLKNVGRIVKIERFSAENVPYPVNKTKIILGKCPY